MYRILLGCSFSTDRQLENKSLFILNVHEPLTETLLHRLPVGPAAIVNCRDDLEGLEPLDKLLQLKKAAVFTIGDTCQTNRWVDIIINRQLFKKQLANLKVLLLLWEIFRV